MIRFNHIGEGPNEVGEVRNKRTSHSPQGAERQKSQRKPLVPAIRGVLGAAACGESPIILAAGLLQALHVKDEESIGSRSRCLCRWACRGRFSKPLTTLALGFWNDS